MKLALALILMICTSCAATSLHEIGKLPKSEPKIQCQGYYVLTALIVTGLLPCQEPELNDEEGCELREVLAETSDFFQCGLSGFLIRWVSANKDEVNWNKIESDFARIQLDNELEGAAQECRQENQEIDSDQIERLTMELFGLDPSTAGDQEECWDDAINELKVAKGIRCALEKFDDGLNYCLGYPLKSGN